MYKILYYFIVNIFYSYTIKSFRNYISMSWDTGLVKLCSVCKDLYWWIILKKTPFKLLWTHNVLDFCYLYIRKDNKISRTLWVHLKDVIVMVEFHFHDFCHGKADFWKFVANSVLPWHSRLYWSKNGRQYGGSPGRTGLLQTCKKSRGSN
jgi:hypothetical protein